MKVNLEYRGRIAYCKEPTVNTLGAAMNHRILWSGYKVRPMEPLCPPSDHVMKKEDIGKPLKGLELMVEDIDFRG